LTIQIREKIAFFGKFRHSKEGFLMGPIKKKGARSFWGKNKRKCEKNTLVAPPGE